MEDDTDFEQPIPHDADDDEFDRAIKPATTHRHGGENPSSWGRVEPCPESRGNTRSRDCPPNAITVASRADSATTPQAIELAAEGGTHSLQEPQSRPVTRSRTRPSSAPRMHGETSGAREASLSVPNTSRKAKEERRLAEIPPKQWEVSDVCKWLESIGMPQHKSKFAHERVDGRLLLRMTSESLKWDLGLALGTRAQLEEEIAKLKSHEEHPRRRPASAPRERHRAISDPAVKALAAQRKAAAARRRAQVTEAERLRAGHVHAQALGEMRRCEAAAARTLGTRGRRSAKPLDPYDLDAWKPAMATKDRLKDFRELGASVATFRPKLCPGSDRILRETLGADDAGGRKDFLSRLESDLRARKMRAKERRRHHNELAEGGAEAQKLRQMKDDAFLRDALQEKLGEPLGEITEELVERVLHQVGPAQLGLTEKQSQVLMSMDDPVKREELLSELDGCLLERDKQDVQVKINRFEKKLKRKRRAWLQQCLRTNNFLHRCNNDMKARDRNRVQTSKMIEVQEKLRKSALPGAKATSASRGRPVEDLRDSLNDENAAADFFQQRLGWFDPKDEMREDDIKEARRLESEEGDEHAELLIEEKMHERDRRLNMLLDLALDERGLMDGTQMRRETAGGGAELGRFACFVFCIPSVFVLALLFGYVPYRKNTECCPQ